MMLANDEDTLSFRHEPDINKPHVGDHATLAGRHKCVVTKVEDYTSHGYCVFFEPPYTSGGGSKVTALPPDAWHRVADGVLCERFPGETLPGWLSPQ